MYIALKPLGVLLRPSTRQQGLYRSKALKLAVRPLGAGSKTPLTCIKAPLAGSKAPLAVSKAPLAGSKACTRQQGLSI